MRYLTSTTNSPTEMAQQTNMTPSQTQPPPVHRVIVQSTPSSRGCCGPNMDHYKGEVSVKLGCIAILLGFATFGVNVAGISTEAIQYNVMVGSVMFILTGAFAICAKNKQVGWIITTMVLAILTFMSNLSSIGYASVFLNRDIYKTESIYFNGELPEGEKNKVSGDMCFGLNLVMLILCLAGFADLLTLSILTCAGSCCGTSSQTGRVISTNPATIPQVYSMPTPSIYSPAYVQGEGGYPIQPLHPPPYSPAIESGPAPPYSPEKDSGPAPPDSPAKESGPAPPYSVIAPSYGEANSTPTYNEPAHSSN